MLTVLRLLLAIPGIFCLGLWPAILAPQVLIETDKRQSRLRSIGLCFGSGLLLNYLLLTTLSLQQALVVSSIMAAGALVFALFLERPDVRSVLNIGKRAWFAVGLLLIFVAAKTFLEPIYDWDARSIWYFHGKMIYFSGGITESAGWHNTLAAFAHMDYPKLIATTAAQFARIAGFWNEYLPKTNLLVILLPALFIQFSFMRAPISSAFLFCFLLLNLGDWLWNGYVDGWVALYFSMLCLVGSEIVIPDPDGRASRIAPATVLMIAGVVASLKNEGMLAVLVFSAVAAATVLPRWRSRQGRTAVAVARTDLLVVVVLPFSAVAAWQVQKHRLDLKNDLFASSGTLSRTVVRMLDPSSIRMIAKHYAMTPLWKCAALLGLSLLAARLVKVRIPTRAIFCVACAFLYLCGITMIYFGTYWNLEDHLNSSVERTILPVGYALLAAAFLVVERVEFAGRKLSSRLERHLPR